MKQKERTELTKKKIIEAGIQEFGTKGYAGFTLNGVCYNHGISKGLFYHNFKGKDELYLACVSKCFSDVTSFLKEQNIKGDLRRYLELRFQYFLLMKDYSHGMKNKMQMLVNIIGSPAILLLDEPLTSFDVVVADEMKKMLKEIKKDHILIFSTHIMELALDLCDEIVILNQGILEEIPKENLDNEEFKDKIIDTLRGEEG